MEKLLEYRKIEKIGEGTYGKVYKAEKIDSGEIVAMKKMKEYSNESGIVSSSLREISILKEIKHKNIVLLKNVIYNNLNLYLIFEYMEKDLKNYIRKNTNKKYNIDPKLIKSIVYQILNGISFCHSVGIIHRDLKPENILIEKDIVKLADFGISRKIDISNETLSNEICTIYYRPPEVLLGNNKYTSSIDLWSIGCIFAELIIGSPLFAGDSEIGQLFEIFKVLGTPNQHNYPNISSLPYYRTTFPVWKTNKLHELPKLDTFDSDGLDLLNKLLIYDPANRITARNALLHKYFDDIRD